MTRRLLLLLLVAGLLAPVASAQPNGGRAPAAEAAVRAALDALFDGMRAGDSTAVRDVFHDGARLYTAVGPSDTAGVSQTPVDAFVESVGQPRERVWDERTWNVKVRVDGPLASAWVPYVFYRGDERSHCGVNAVQLVRGPDGWRILQLTDTRRQACDVPPEVQKSR
ncbi:nuclear transport factor 2 family protein [Salinibacter sp.]|uniref:nuclear transport factor 2 family protein n=1 Tax=Salinibacter sp. TaxID=2065818 RepID=UPI0021E6DEBC|nr:nuclear transport factor 2 family protein [Salinibacter sp.]